MPTSSNHKAPKTVLMVCLGNICRSPLAEEVLRQKAQQAGFKILVDSCGTGHWHEGEQADKRSRTVAKARGYDIDNLRARQITNSDFTKFDLMLAMDKQNLADITNIKNKLIASGKLAESELPVLALFSERDQTYQYQKVPDPYYGDMTDFEHALDLVESMADAWVKHWQ